MSLSIQYVSTHTSEKWGTDFVSERESYLLVLVFFAVLLLNLDILNTVKRIQGAPPSAPVPAGRSRRKSAAESIMSGRGSVSRRQSSISGRG
jgi:hypothetical protein